MKKTLVLAVIAVLNLGTVNAINFTGESSTSIVNSADESIGTIIELNATGGKLMDNISGEILDFENPANVILTEGGVIVYVTVVTPNKVIRIIKNVKN